MRSRFPIVGLVLASLSLAAGGSAAAQDAGGLQRFSVSMATGAFTQQDRYHEVRIVCPDDRRRIVAFDDYDDARRRLPAITNGENGLYMEGFALARAPVAQIDAFSLPTAARPQLKRDNNGVSRLEQDGTSLTETIVPTFVLAGEDGDLAVDLRQQFCGRTFYFRPDADGIPVVTYMTVFDPGTSQFSVNLTKLAGFAAKVITLLTGADAPEGLTKAQDITEVGEMAEELFGPSAPTEYAPKVLGVGDNTFRMGTQTYIFRVTAPNARGELLTRGPTRFSASTPVWLSSFDVTAFRDSASDLWIDQGAGGLTAAQSAAQTAAQGHCAALATQMRAKGLAEVDVAWLMFNAAASGAAPVTFFDMMNCEADHPTRLACASLAFRGMNVAETLRSRPIFALDATQLARVRAICARAPSASADEAASYFAALDAETEGQSLRQDFVARLGNRDVARFAARLSSLVSAPSETSFARRAQQTAQVYGETLTLIVPDAHIDAQSAQVRALRRDIARVTREQRDLQASRAAMTDAAQIRKADLEIKDLGDTLQRLGPRSAVLADYLLTVGETFDFDPDLGANVGQMSVVQFARALGAMDLRRFGCSVEVIENYFVPVGAEAVQSVLGLTRDPVPDLSQWWHGSFLAGPDGGTVEDAMLFRVRQQSETADQRPPFEVMIDAIDPQGFRIAPSLQRTAVTGGNATACQAFPVKQS